MAQDKTYLFEKMTIHKAVASLAIPTVLSQLVMVLYNLADTYFVGMLNDPIQNAAVTLAAPILLAFNAINNLFGVGCSSMMSRALGRKDADSVRKSSAFGFYGSVFSGVLFSLLCVVMGTSLLYLLGVDSDTIQPTAEYMRWTVYLGATPAILNVVMAHMVRSEGAAMHASIGTMSGCLLNIILDPIFILVFQMGAQGAGLATFLSNVAACLYFMVLLYVKRGKTYVCIRPSAFSFAPHIVKGVCAVGIPASIQNLLNVTGMTILNHLAAGYGFDAVAAMGIAQKIYMVPMYINMGISQGIMPLIAYTYSAQNYQRMKQSILFTAKVVASLITAMAVLIYWNADGLITLFMDHDVIIAYGSRFLHGFTLGLPFLCIDFLAVGIFQAVGMGKAALIFAIMRKIILEIPALLLLNAWFPLYGLAYAQTVAEIVLALRAFMVLRRLFQQWHPVAAQEERPQDVVEVHS